MLRVLCDAAREGKKSRKNSATAFAAGRLVCGSLPPPPCKSALPSRSLRNAMHPLPTGDCASCCRSAADHDIAAHARRHPTVWMIPQALHAPASTDTKSRLRSISVLSPRRPQLPWACGAIATVPPTHASPVAAEAPDVLPKVSSHPALQGIQVRNGPRDTYKPTNLVRKRRHGFLSRIRTRKGRAILKRRKAKGRGTLSH